MMEILFQNPAFLYALWALLPLGLLLLHARGQRIRAAARLLSGEMRSRLMPIRSGLRSLVPIFLLLLALASLTLALARPRFGMYFEKVSQRGSDLVVLLDVSRSMLSEDVHPNRLGRSKQYIRDLLDRVRGDRVGLVVFAGKAVQACPLTTDHAFFTSILDEVGPDSAPRGGTVIGDAIREATRTLETVAGRDQAFVLITDGEDQDSFPREAAGAAAELGVKIFTVGIGDPGEGARIPLDGDDGNLGFVKHEGQEVWSKMDEPLLKEIALESNGAYVPARTGTYDLGQVYTDHLKNLRAGELDSEQRKRYREQYQLFAAVGLFLFLISVLVRPHRFRDRNEGANPRGGPAAAAVLAALLLLPASRSSAQDGRDPEQGARLHNQALAGLEAGDIDAALLLLEQARVLAPDEPRIELGIGVALHRKGELKDAADRYGGASAGGDASATAVARYNLGSLAVDRAREILGAVPEEAQGDAREQGVAEIEQAIAQFRATLKLQPEHLDARHNLELLRVWLKYIRDAWRQRDEQRESNENDLVTLLETFLKEQAGLRSELDEQRRQDPSPRRDGLLLKQAETQRDLARRVALLPPKVEELIASQAGGAAAGPGGPGSSGAPAGPDPAQLEAVQQQMLALVDTAVSGMNSAADLLEGAEPDAAVAGQKLAHESLDTLWSSVAPFDRVLRRAIDLEEGVVEATAPHAEALPGSAGPDALESAWLIENQDRVGALAPLLELHAEQTLPQLDQMLESPPELSEGGEEEDEQRAQLEKMVQQTADLKKAMEKALENAPLIPELARAASQALGEGGHPAALESEEEILRLLREIAELMPEQEQEQQGDPDQDQQGDQDQDQQQEDQEEQEGEQDEEKKDQEQKDGEQDQEQQEQDGQQEEQESEEKPGELSKEQVQQMIQQALDREKEYKDKKKELQKLLAVPVRVEKDW